MQNEGLRRAQTALDSERARYFDLYDRAPVCYITIGEQELIIEANLTTADLLGVARGVLVKQPLSKFIFKEDKDILYRHIKHPFKADAQQAFDIRMVKNDRTVFWAHLTTMTVADADGNLMCRVSISDITERKKVEEALRQSEERLQLAIQAADVGIFEFDIVNNHLTWDDTMCRFYGITPDKFGSVHRAWEEWIHPEDLPKVQGVFQQALAGERDFDMELRCVKPEGSIHWLKANARIQRDRKGRPLRVIGTNLDITGHKLLVEAAEVANRAKSLFIGNMSHELRTPLSVVLSMTEALLNTPVTDKQRDYGEKLRKSGKALLGVVSNILDFSEIEAGRMALSNAPFSVEAMIRSVVKLFAPKAAEEKIEFHTILDPELPILRGDAPRLTQVVENLVGNAVKFTKAGEIRVAVRILRRTGSEIDLAIDVQDTGIGMTEEEISRLFQAFGQLDPSMTRRYGGTGLGLVISRNLIQLMGGTIQVASVFGKGSLFTVLVTLPIALGFVGSDGDLDGSELEFAGTGQKSAPLNPPARKEGPPGDMAELQALLEQLGPALASRKPLPCKEILAQLREKSWPEEQETLLTDLSFLVRNYRLADALTLLNKDATDR